MSSGELLHALQNVGVIPVVTPPALEDVLPLCEALRSGGVPAIEVTFRAAGAAEVIGLVRDHAPDFLVGAGTVTTCEQAREAAAAGAQFAVAPGLNPDVALCAQRVDLPFLPGICTPSEIERAMAMGLSVLKFFPAGALGGARTVQAMVAPYRHLGLWVVPTGGIDASNASSYWETECVAAVGGTWLAPPSLVEARHWDEVTLRASAAAERYRKTRRPNA